MVRDLGSIGSWSYGYRVTSSDVGPAPDGSGKQVQFLRKLETHEISPVLVGAGAWQTQTVADSVKADVLRELVRFQRMALPPVDHDNPRELVGREYARFVRDHSDRW